MPFSKCLGITALSLAQRALSQCVSGRVFDDFSAWSDGNNLFGYHAGDDSTMAAIAVEQNTLRFTAGNGSYFYETLPCEQATDQGYYGFSFDVQGPASSTFAVELQTMDSCAVNEYSSYYVTIDGIIGSMQNIVIPWGDFEGQPNPNAIVGIVWFDFATGVEWAIKNIKFVCENSLEGTATPSTTDGPGPT